jgi:hypothetical protein
MTDTNFDPVRALKDTGVTDVGLFSAPARDPDKPWMVYGAGSAIDVSQFDPAVIQGWRSTGHLSGTSSVTVPNISITNVTAAPVEADHAHVTWTTDVEASSQVNYGADESYGTGSSLIDTDPGVTSHDVGLDGLTPETLYHYSVTSTAGERTSSSPDATFTTVAPA